MILFRFIFMLTCLGFGLASIQAAEPEARTVVVFGDSITEGTALPAGNREGAWIRQVEKEAAGKLVLVNEGKGGRPTASLGEFKEMLHRRPKANLLVLALGANDARTVDGTCVPNAIQNLGTMIALARETYGREIAILLVGPTNIRKDALGPSKPIAEQREENLKALNAAIGKLATETGCDFVSLYGVVPDESLGKDGVHPDADGNGSRGNTAIARALLPKLLPPAP